MTDNTRGKPEPVGEREAFVEWLETTWPKVYPKGTGDELWRNGHLSALAWQARALLASTSAPAAEQAEPMTDEQVLQCVRSVGLPVPMGLTRDRGPYEVTEPTWFLTNLVRAIEAHHGITAQAGEVQS